MDDLNLNASRRSFIKAAGVFALGAGAMATLGGCAPKGKASHNDSVQSVEDISWDGEYDVIVVGGGIAGLATAATVALEGEGATCLLLEKSDNCGGNSFQSSGFCMRTEEPEKFFETYIKGLQGDTGCTSDEVLKAYCDGLVENEQWLLSLGADPYMSVMGPGYEGSQSNQNPEYPEIDGAQYMGAIRFTGGEDGKGPKHIALFFAAVCAAGRSRRIYDERPYDRLGSKSRGWEHSWRRRRQGRQQILPRQGRSGHVHGRLRERCRVPGAIYGYAGCHSCCRS